MKALLKSGLTLATAGLLFLLIVQMLARATWSLSPAGDTALASLRSQTAPVRRWTVELIERAVREGKVHRVEEWPPANGPTYNQAPMLDPRVARAELPAVEDRVGPEPLVIVPPEQCGPYGGTWNRYDIVTVRQIGARYGYEQLIRAGPLGRSYLPNLAKQWEPSNDGRTWTVFLRRGVRWSDGHPFTTADIRFWYEHMLCDPEISPGARNSETYAVGGRLMELKVVDEATVRFHFAAPNGQFPMHAASGGYRPFPAHYLRQFHPRLADPDELDRHLREAKMAGPYALFNLKSYYSNYEQPTLNAWVAEGDITPGRPSVWVRNPYYWKVDRQGNQLPYIDRIVFHLAGNDQMVTLKALSGQVGMQARLIKFSDYPLIMAKSLQSKDPGSPVPPFSILHWIGPNTVRLIPNLNHRDPVLNELLTDRRFRIALSVAIDRRRINEVQFYGLGTARQNCPTAISPFYSPRLESAHVEYDPDRANSLLDELGLADHDADGIRLRRDGLPLTLSIDSNMQTGFVDALQLVTEDWRAVGIKAKLNIQSRRLWRLRYWAGLHDIYASWYDCRENPFTNPPCPTDRYSPMARLWGQWYETQGAEGQVPPPDMRRCMELWRQACATPDIEGQVRVIGRIQDLMAENLYEFGLVGDVPRPVIVLDRFRNVPEVSYYDWATRGPGNSAPECYALEP